jgi:hypothetical protein
MLDSTEAVERRVKSTLRFEHKSKNSIDCDDESLVTSSIQANEHRKRLKYNKCVYVLRLMRQYGITLEHLTELKNSEEGSQSNMEKLNSVRRKQQNRKEVSEGVQLGLKVVKEKHATAKLIREQERLDKITKEERYKAEQAKAKLLKDYISGSTKNVE